MGKGKKGLRRGIMAEINVNYYNWERDCIAPPWFSRLTCSDGSLTVMYTSPSNSEEDNA
jgi:predicted secreted Zn-dependent protease